jgi:hypothetical protein
LKTQPVAVILPEITGEKTTALETRPDDGRTYWLIPLTQGYSAMVSLSGYQRFSHLKWTATVQRRNGVIVRVYAYRLERGADGKWHNLFLHRAVMDAKPGQKVDHRKRGMSTLDCRESNLRFATYSQNNANKTPRVGKHGFFGIHRGSGSNRWYGAVCINRKSHHTKRFPSPELAAAARDVLARRLHGEFAVLNFPA